MSVNCSWIKSQLLQHSGLQQTLPSELIDTIRTSTGPQFLDGVASAAIVPGCTETIFSICRQLTTELVNRLIRPGESKSLSSDIAIIAAFAKVLPYVAFVQPQVKDFLTTSRLRSLLLDITAFGQQLTDDDTASLLLSLFRLLSTNIEAFQDEVRPTFLSYFLSHADSSIRYLAVQSLCAVMHFADHLSEKLIEKHVGLGPIYGWLGDRKIDFRVFKLLEEKRWSYLSRSFSPDPLEDDVRHLEFNQTCKISDLMTTTASFDGVLVPRMGPLETHETSFVSTKTANYNLRSLGSALLSQKPILVAGPTGSGKSSLIAEAARLLNRQKSILTLHLNEQTDAKSLIGLYTSSTTDDSFVWQPGVLTKALQQGRWLLIEDIDRVPSDVLGVLKPLFEEGTLFLPTRKERVRPAPGFKVFATMKTSTSSNSVGRLSWLTNDRLWSTIRTQAYEANEIIELLETRFPPIKRLLPELIRAHTNVCLAYQNEQILRSQQSRLPTLRDLLKWCQRVAYRIQLHTNSGTVGLLPESLKGDIYHDALDRYVAHHSDNAAFTVIARQIAESLNISPQQVDFFLNPTGVAIKEDKTLIAIGRSTIPKIASHKALHGHREAFALTSLARRILNCAAAAISYSEPLLLVGETGVGKTTAVQHIARLVNQRLTVVNLSQQSEATDLLGGLKPINTRSLLLPLFDQFTSLFDDTFSVKRNEKFQLAINKAFSKQNWTRLILLWQEAFRMAESALRRPSSVEVETEGNVQSAKRRKIVSKHAHLRERWSNFKSRVNHVHAQVERGDRTQTFAFVEGKLVEAVRRGEWLLLDEINLAAADTLDHIVSLLHDGDDDKPFLLLTESGEIEQIIAHPSFRVFAAMNPATDMGKKDLSPGIRARFTEVFVQSGDSQIDDLVQIIESYLGDILSNDSRAARDLANAYLQLKSLNSQHKLTDGAGDVPHFSIRSLVRCLLYTVQHTPAHGLRRAMYEGFAMSFFTVLSRVSENLAIPLTNACILSTIKNPKSFLSQQPKMKFDSNEYIAFQHHLVRRGPLDPDLQPYYIRTPSVERNLLNLARAASMQKFPILLQGPTSAGKTSMVEYLAKLSGNKFVRINNHEHTDLQEYLGSYATGEDGKLEFREGVLVQALRQGHWVVLDELNLAPTDVLEALNRLLDDNRELLIPESQEIVRPHSNFMLFATQNPAGLYGGRKRLSRAFRNRFLELHFDDIPENELEVILQRRSQIPQSFCAQIVQVYKKLSLQRQATKLFDQKNSFATLRDLFRWASRPVDDRTKLAYHGFMLLGERVRNVAEREIVKTTIEQTMKVAIDETSLYGESKIPQALHGSSIVWTPAMVRLFVLVSECLRNNEPVLLVGETGCGKTHICQTVSELFGRTLSIYNAHSNTETGDLIGSQRPIRSRMELRNALLDSFDRVLGDALNSSSMKNADIETLISSFNQMDTSNLDPELVAHTKKSIGAYQSLFTWNDGSLVRSMKAGEHFLLDEISLADDSVLERLNSVLEPSRTILLAEKGSEDNHVVAQPGFQFLATMNPGGDYGKRELSAALRNRLTEIWVPPLSKEDDVLPILEVSLGEELHQLAPLLLSFAVWYNTSVQGSMTTTISLRALLAWTAFITQNRHLKVESAFVHGAALVYVDSLGANPAAALTTSSNIEKSRKACLVKLGSLINVDAAAIYMTIPTLSILPASFQIGDFSLPRTVQSQVPDIVFEASTTLKNTMRIVRALQMSRPILLEGNPGVGKTAIVTALAGALGKHFTRINLSDQTDLMDLFGADAPSEDEKLGHFSWQDGPLLQAMQSGGWVLLDEMNLASQSVLEGLNSCLDHRQEIYIAELDRSFACHPDFVLFAAQNPHHQGGGRKGLPASFVNRFTVVYADPFETSDLIQISRQKRPDMSIGEIQSVVAAIEKVQQAVEQYPELAAGGPWEFNLRDVMRWLDLCHKFPKIPPVSHFEVLVTARFRSFQARAILSSIRDDVFGQTQEQSLYHQLTTHNFQVGTGFLERDPERQRVQAQFLLSTGVLGTAKSAIVALNSKWPIILAGPSGCGKTQLIRTLAALSGAKLMEFSMNSDIDTMDIVGGFEQHDIRRDHLALQSEMRENILQFISSYCTVDRVDPRSGKQAIASLMSAYETCSKSDVEIEELVSTAQSLSATSPIFQKLNEKYQMITEVKQRKGPRFAWNDGLLLDALRDGAWLVLDNANLCNPSVLDRLNSLLEPSGSLIVSEQHGADQKDRTVRPHPKFRLFLTMDPKFGELSRAMRNRSLELFMEPRSHSIINFEPPRYPSTASIYNMRMATDIQDVEKLSKDLVKTNIEILSKSQQCLLADQLYSLVPERDRMYFEEHLSDWASMPTTVQAKIVSFYHSASEAVQMRHFQADCDSEPQLPMLNEPLLSLVGANHEKIESFTHYILAHLHAQSIARTLALVTSVVNDDKARQITVLQKAAEAALRPKATKVRGILPAYQFLEMLFNSMINNDVLQWTPFTRSVLSFTSDCLAFFNQSTVDHSQLRAYLQIAKDLMKSGSDYDRILTKVLSNCVELFGPDIGLKTGQSFQAMWQLWRPTQSSSWVQLNTQMSMKNVLRQFDQLVTRIPQPRKELASLRLGLVNSLRQLMSDDRPLFMVDDLSRAVMDLEMQSSVNKPRHGHFSAIFQWILQNLATNPSMFTSLDLQRLFLLAEDPRILIIKEHDSRLTRNLNLLSFLSLNATGRSGHCDIFSSSQMAHQLVRKIYSMERIPIQNLSLVTEEISELLHTLYTSMTDIELQSISSIGAGAFEIIRGILESHKEMLAPEAINCLNDSMSIGMPNRLASLDALGDSPRNQSYFEQVIVNYVQPALKSLSSNDCGSVFDLGLALAQACFGALKLFVPNHLFDPAVYPGLVHQRHCWRQYELRSIISSHQRFQQRVSGQDSSSLIRMFQKDLDSLGEAPPAPSVLRPKTSELSSIQEVFTNIIQNIIGNPNLEEIIAARNEFSSEQIDDLEKDITSVVVRLTNFDAAYADIIEPLSQLLQSLSLGLRMMYSKPGTMESSMRNQDLSHVPLLGAHIDNVMTWNMDRKRASSLSAASAIHFLEYLNVKRRLEHPLQAPDPSQTLEIVLVIERFYDEWKFHLSQDQAEAEAKSRYYTYRGNDEDTADEDSIEMAALFPTFESEPSDVQDSNTKYVAAAYDARAAGNKLAKLHMQLFESSASCDGLERYISRSLQAWSAHFADHVIQHNSFSSLLPGVILQLEGASKHISEQQVPEKFNIYTDTSILELQATVKLIGEVQVRFQTIGDKWPEHAVPVEVLNFCDEFLDFKVREPIAKLLTKIEKLLEMVARWQSVASREWSVTNLVDSLTARIVHWRRLELMSWSKLLDAEQTKNEEDANAWYFIAYEAVVHNSMVVIEQGTNVVQYCQELIKTLEDFLKSASLGQYSCRLRILNVFVQTLASLAKQHDGLEDIVNCVKSICYHYGRYEEKVEQTLKTGRKDLERNINEQIQLASWKDVNVQSLKDSARRSHYKLFKTIRKYRALLAQPMLSFQASSAPIAIDIRSNQLHSPHLYEQQLMVACQECSRQLLDWDRRPERLRNPSGASLSMQKLYNSATTALIIHETIAEMNIDIRNSADELRKQTPAMLTEENTSLVRHLRGRKRRLFADTMKNVIHMGIRRNLGVKELQNQSSTSIILAHSPDISIYRNESASHVSNFAFHQFLDNMPGIRTASRDHSEDLSDGEVSRATGLLEGLLSLMLNQRSSLHKASKSLNLLSEILQSLNNLQEASVHDISQTKMHIANRSARVYQVASWLCGIMRVACHILTMRSQHTGTKLSSAVITMTSYSDRIQECLKQAMKRKVFPPGLRRKGDIDLLNDIETAFKQLLDELELVMKKEPEIKFIITQILPWLESAEKLDSVPNGELYVNISTFDIHVRQLLDRVFVAIQKVTAVRTKFPRSTEEQGWLAQSSSLLQESLRALHVHDICSDLKQLTQQLEHLEKGQLNLGLCLITVATPIFEQYYIIASHVYEQQLFMHLETSKFADSLSKSFASLLRDGFCTPSDPSDGQENNSGKLESGTGLGEGEGAEDISKDIGDDEDLSELAQADAEKPQDGKEMDKSKDAVDMGADDLQGDNQSADASGNDSEDDQDGEDKDGEDDMDEETGSVDELDPTAVDEKMWDDIKNEPEKADKDLQSQKQQGSKTDEDTAKSENEQNNENAEEEAMELPDGDEAQSESEIEGEGRSEAENIDPHLQEQETLDLPEDMQIGDEDAQHANSDDDDDMDNLSDIDQTENIANMEEVENISEGGQEEFEDVQKEDDLGDEDEGEEDIDAQAKHDETTEEPNEDERIELPSARDNDMSYDIDDNDAGESGQANQRQAINDTNEEHNRQEQGESDQVVEEEQAQSGKGSNQEEQQGDAGRGTVERGAGREDEPRQKQDEALKKLADILENFHQRREILTAAEDRQQGELDQDIDMADADFEHLGADQSSDAQALGAADAEQAQNVDQSKAIEDHEPNIDQDLPMADDADGQELQREAESMAERLSRLQTQSQEDKDERIRTVQSSATLHHHSREALQDPEDMDKDLEIEDNQQDKTQLISGTEDKPTSILDATELWNRCSTSTHALSLMLTEQLRLILAPTTATKLRGDFRTGKRLNIKRIIPYIASGYKRDKIWMRRSIPSKRNYQVMIAVDDSKSMSENGADLLAFETVAMLSKSLSLLEVGELCVVNFGEEPHIRVAHPFGRPFSTPDSGIEIFQHFSFAQKGTDVRNLIRESIALFEDAKLRAGQTASSSTSTDLWQLQLIVSDGHCSDHESIRRLVRAARESKIMIVFVIVDAGQDSIMDLKQAVFEKSDPMVENSEMTVKTRRYLETFPFQYYVIVRDVSDLPGVLARVLKGWFESVVETQ